MTTLQLPTAPRAREFTSLVPSALIIFAYIIFASVLALASKGVYHDDDLQHFEMARWAWHDPRYLLNLWGRPGCTIPYALIANIGTDQTAFMLCRFLTICFAVASAVFTALCARKIGIRKPELAIACLLFMPLYFHLSYTTLTEIVCGVYLIAGTYLLLINRCTLGAVVLGLAPLARQESVALLAIVGVMLLYHRRFLACILLGWGLVAWQLFAMAFVYDTPLGAYLRPKPTEMYGSGGPFHFVMMWGEAIGPSFVGLCLMGSIAMIVALVAFKKGTGPINRLSSASAVYALIIPLGSLGMVLLHTLIFMRGLFAGGGYARFLLPACPWMAICIAYALEYLWHHFHEKNSSPISKTGNADQSDTDGHAALSDEAPSRLVRFMPLLVVIGIAAVNLGLWLNARQPDGSMAWRWPHWQLIIAWKVGILMPLPALAVFLWRNKTAFYIILGLIIVDATGNLALQAQPHRLAQTQVLLEQGINAAVERMKSQSATASHPNLILGFSPWIPYFRSVKDPTYTPPSTMDGAPDDQWRAGPSGTIFVYDSSLSPSRIQLDELASTGNAILSLNLKNSKQAPDPYVVVFEKR